VVLCWYAIACDADGRRDKLLAAAGYFGPPSDGSEIERLERLLDSGTDELGLILMDEQLPERVRQRKSARAL
jgi:hypothetical protein